MSTNRILDVKAKTGDTPFTRPADDEIYVLKARISDLRDACEQKQEILDSNKAIIAEQAERIAALEAVAAKECDCCGYTKGNNLAEYRKLMRYGSELAFERLEAELTTLRERAEAAEKELLDTTWQDHADHWQKEAKKLERELSSLRERAEAAEKTARFFGEIMAVIHRDGGHYLDEHGPDKSFQDAHQIWGEMQSELSTLRESKPKLLGYIHSTEFIPTFDPSLTVYETAELGCAIPVYTLSVPPQEQEQKKD